MAIEKAHNDVFCVCCDTCSCTEEFDGDFLSVIEQMKDSNWKIEKDKKGEWDHTCPDCVEKENEQLDKEI